MLKTFPIRSDEAVICCLALFFTILSDEVCVYLDCIREGHVLRTVVYSLSMTPTVTKQILLNFGSLRIEHLILPHSFASQESTFKAKSMKALCLEF